MSCGYDLRTELSRTLLRMSSVLLWVALRLVFVWGGGWGGGRVV